MSRIVLNSQKIAGIIALALTATASIAEANVLNSCITYCHGLPPRDGFRKANPHFDSQSSAFSGNHRTHLPATPVVASCSVCHAQVIQTDFGHQNGTINMANSLKGYSSASIRAKYDKGLFINQTSIPNLATATCSNVSCHFETKSPAWNAAPLVYPAGCSVCHGVPPSGGSTGAAGSHVRHDAYFTGATGCQKCHPGYASFSHASSAGRSLRVQGYLRDPANNLEPAGTYSGSGTNYFPSQSALQAFGTCNTVYCHSSGQGTTGTGAITYQPVVWGSAALNCGSCHQNMASASTATGSHQLHATAATTANGTGVNFTCQVCHGLSYSRSKTPAVLGGSHVNKNIELSFTTISGANAVGTNYSKSVSFAPGTAYGQCSSSACHGSGKPIWGINTTRPECFKCHGSTVAAFTTVSAASVAPGFNGEGRDTAGNTVATSPRVGAHQTHLTAADSISNPIHCGECHTTHLTVKDATHLNFTTATITFGPLARTASHSPAVSRTAGVISCSNTYCHTGNRSGATASSTTPVFTSATLIGNTTIADTCTGKCHGMPPGGAVVGDVHATLLASGSYTTPASLSACSSQTGGTGCHPTLAAAPTSMGTVFFDKAKHINGTVEASGGHVFPYPGSVHKAAASPITACTACHTNGSNTTYPVASGVKPDCRACHALASPGSGCITCHGMTATDGRPSGNVFPNISGSHTKHVVVQGMACNDCHFTFGTGASTHGSSNRVAHNNVTFVGLSSPTGKFRATKTTTSASCSNIACHGNATWGTKLGCLDCHTVAITRTKGRPGTQLSAVTTEFGLAWGHKKTGRGAVTDADCIVCHLEGNFTSQRTSAYHGDGNIDLRDPDGAGETPITNISGAAFTFQRFSTAYTAGSRTSTGHTSNSIDNVITQKFCVACHDSNGAINTTARTAGGTATMPFGGVNLGASYTVANGTASAGGLVDVKTQFATTNSSFHPLLGPKNRDYPTAARMNDPYKPTGTRGTSGTLSQGVVLNCFDCHNVVGTPLTRRTVAAHGNAVTVRGTVAVSGTPSATNAVTLCGVCHASYNTGNNHGAGSAFTNSTDGGMTAYVSFGCNICHSSGFTTAVPRPIRAQDTHGSNALGTVGTLLTATNRWSTSPTPIAFIRNRQVLPNHTPRKIGATTYTPNCMGGNTSPCSQGQQTYSPAGTY